MIMHTKQSAYGSQVSKLAPTPEALRIKVPEWMLFTVLTQYADLVEHPY